MNGRRLVRILKWQLALLVALALAGEAIVRWKYQGRLLVDPSAAGMYAPDPELGFKFNPACTGGGVNSLGIRHAELARVKPPGTARLFVLGDSVSADLDSYVALLRQKLPTWQGKPVEIVNCAIPGYTTWQERRLFERDLADHQPDFVLLQHCLNDNHRFLHQLDPNGGWLFTLDARRALLGDGQDWLTRVTRFSYLAFELRLYWLALTRRHGSEFPWEDLPDFCAAWQDHTWPDAEEHLRAIKAACDRIGARFAVMSVPFEPQLDPALLARNRAYTLKPQRLLAEICTRAGIPLLDLFQDFAAHQGPRLFTDRIHLTPAGHALVAERLRGFVQ